MASYHSAGSLGRKARTARRASRSRAPQLLPVARIHIALSAIKPASLAPVASAACIFNAASGLLRFSANRASKTARRPGEVQARDRKSVVEGKRVPVPGDLGGGRHIKKQHKTNN